MGIASEEEVEQVLHYKRQYPEVDAALYQIELEVENFAEMNSIKPPAGTLEKIEEKIRELQLREKSLRRPIEFEREQREEPEVKSPYIEVESQSSHMRIHKAWRWVFAAVFVLGKIFLGFAIYFYLSNRQAQEQIQQLKLEIKQGSGR